MIPSLFTETQTITSSALFKSLFQNIDFIRQKRRREAEASRPIGDATRERQPLQRSPEPFTAWPRFWLTDGRSAVAYPVNDRDGERFPASFTAGTGF
jgi:hypothetical protein